MLSLRNAFIILLFLSHYTLLSQFLDINLGENISGFPGDEINTQWSPDGNCLIFESIKDGKNSIYMYDYSKDTIIHIVSEKSNFRNPIWHPDGKSIIIDSDINGDDLLFKVNIDDFRTKPLFWRKIICREPSYSTSERQIYFTGYSETENKWEVYSYDFIYDNLNVVSSERFNCTNPRISPDGKLVIYNNYDPFTNSTKLKLMNWYGEMVNISTDIVTTDYQWHPAGLKFLFIDDDINGNSQLYSVWKDGSHLEQITDTELKISSPSVSPDGRKIALSVKNQSGFDVYIINFEDY